MRVIPWLVVTAGAVLMVAGIISGEALTVMRQAVTVCLECIGIG